jgi:hypothetical protein
MGSEKEPRFSRDVAERGLRAVDRTAGRGGY